MNLSRVEQETIINFNEEEQTASVYTHRKSLQKKLTALTESRPTECKLTRTSHDGLAMEFEVPKRWIKVSPPRASNMTEEQKQIASERLAEFRAKQKQTP